MSIYARGLEAENESLRQRLIDVKEEVRRDTIERAAEWLALHIVADGGLAGRRFTTLATEGGLLEDFLSYMKRTRI